jgi:hypothetical protein
MVDDIRNDLDVRLRLIPATHHAEADAQVIALHEGGNDGMQRPLPRREGIRMRAIEGKNRPPRLWSANPAPSGTTQDPKLAKLLWMSDTTFRGVDG